MPLTRPQGSNAGVCQTACAMLSLTLACNAAPERPPLQLAGEFLSYAADAEVELCPGTLVQSEEWMKAVAERLGMDPEQIQPTTYYFVDEELATAECGELAAHCTRREDGGLVVFSTELANKHELVHTLHLSFWPDRQQILQEGLAHGFDDRFPQHSFAPGPEALDAAIANESPTGDGEVTVVGGFFVSWLYRRYGAGTLEEVWTSSATPTTAAQFRADFELVVGEALSLAFPDAGTLGCPVMTCPGVPRPWVDGLWTTRSPDGCEDDTVVGSIGADSYLVLRTDLMEVTAGGTYEIEVSGGASSGVQITPCDWPCGGVVVASGAVETRYLESGLYRVETAQWEAQTPPYTVTIRPL